MTQKPKMKTPIIPIDPSDWTLEDWRDLHNGIEEIKQRIAARYAPRDKGIALPPVDNEHVEPVHEQFKIPKCAEGTDLVDGVINRIAEYIERNFGATQSEAVEFAQEIADLQVIEQNLERNRQRRAKR